MNERLTSRRNAGEDGFTLIELLVVVLILGILMAIAIPTFLSLTSGAKANAAESDLTTAVQDENGYEEANSDFDGTTATTPTATDNISASATPPGMNAIDPGLTWTTTLPATTSAGTKTIYVRMITVTSIILGTAGSNGSFYWIYDNNGALSYDTTTTAPTTTTPAAPTTPAWGSSWKTATTAN